MISSLSDPSRADADMIATSLTVLPHRATVVDFMPGIAFENSALYINREGTKREGTLGELLSVNETILKDLRLGPLLM